VRGVERGGVSRGLGAPLSPSFLLPCAASMRRDSWATPDSGCLQTRRPSSSSTRPPPLARRPPLPPPPPPPLPLLLLLLTRRGQRSPGTRPPPPHGRRALQQAAVPVAVARRPAHLPKAAAAAAPLRLPPPPLPPVPPPHGRVAAAACPSRDVAQLQRLRRRGWAMLAPAAPPVQRRPSRPVCCAPTGGGAVDGTPTCHRAPAVKSFVVLYHLYRERDQPLVVRAVGSTARPALVES
jgi:hypothetical protein